MNPSTIETLSSCLNSAVVIFGLLAAVATMFALYFSNQLNKIKDEELERFKQKSNERIAVADSVAAEANKRSAEASVRSADANKQAAEANERAAEANKKAEEERLARVKIEKQLAPRTFSESDIEEISNALRSFASNFSGRKVKVSSYALDAEGSMFALLIYEILFRAGIDADAEAGIGRMFASGIPEMGVKITGPTIDSDFMFKLQDEIFTRLKTKIGVESNDEYTELSIAVGIKPVAGLPKLLMPNKQE